VQAQAPMNVAGRNWPGIRNAVGQCTFSHGRVKNAATWCHFLPSGIRPMTLREKPYSAAWIGVQCLHYQAECRITAMPFCRMQTLAKVRPGCASGRLSAASL
jgi:hypothetical protein